MAKSSELPYELIRCETNEDWLKQRMNGIGGSDVAALMGLSRYKSPYALWSEKTGLVEPEDISDKPAVEWGNVLEPVVGRYYMIKHPERKVKRLNAICRSKRRPWAQASLDYELKDPELGWGVLEIKTAGFRSQDDWKDGVPLYYQTQVMHYLSVTGRAFADVAVLIGGNDYREYRLMRDDADIEVIDRAVDDFWAAVIEKREPKAGVLDGQVLLSRHPEAGAEFVFAETEEQRFAVIRWRNRKLAYEQAQKDLKEAEAELKQLIGDNRGIETSSGLVSWGRFRKRKFNQKQFLKDNPELAEKYFTTVDATSGLRWRDTDSNQSSNKKE